MRSLPRAQQCVREQLLFQLWQHGPATARACSLAEAPAVRGLDFFTRGRQAEYDAHAAGGAAVAVLPAPDAPRTDAEQLGDAVLCEAERAECRAEFGRGR